MIAAPLAVGGSSNTLFIVALIVVLGVTAQVLADRFRVPSVLFLILAGVAVGPKGLSIVTLDVFGSQLSTVVGISVAIIVFEGAFHLKVDKVREAPSAAFRLVTVGALLAFVGTTVAVHYLLGVGWGISAVTGSLLVATGPTVITPILDVVPVRDPVAAALETEGIVNDVTAAVAAVVFFSLLSSTSASALEYLVEFVERISLGVFIGLVTAAVIWYLLTRVELPRGWMPQNARLMTLAGAVLAFSVADTLEPEAGVAAVATAGVVLGNADLPYEDTIEEFKGDVTILVLSFVFIALSALIEFETLFSLGLAGLAVVGFVALILRPLLVFASTTGGELTRDEKLFVSFVGPRGIIPASVATLFALELRNAKPPSNPEGAGVLAGTVFLVILVTVVLEGGFARQIAEKLQVIPMHVIVIGGGRVGRELANMLEDRGENVVVLEHDADVAERLRKDGFTVHEGNGTEIGDLRDAGADRANITVAATGDDDTNLLVTQLAETRLGVERVITRVNEPDNLSAFNELDIETVAASSSTAWAIDNLIERPALSKWMGELGRSGDVQEIEMTDEETVGKTVGEIDEILPKGCVIALVSRGGENKVPELDFVVESGDRLTVLGRTDAVDEAIERLHPHD
ncbi:cation:proton antiporter [Haladaptatus sp. F3-133]|uniref:Cation:proton antiporter n=1 Tax=Halorutilus salinus TaxID=2487751 RepID=A0A9Q4GI96_9EURY|nr:cation:proton antiporter [Halorutilus salinus]MCX2819635.1 cation:proton antiporter [Halorutilus salinus]